MIKVARRRSSSGFFLLLIFPFYLKLDFFLTIASFMLNAVCGPHWNIDSLVSNLYFELLAPFQRVS